MGNWFSYVFFIFVVKFPARRYLFSFIHVINQTKVMSESVKQYLISCPTLVSRYVSLNIFSEKKFTVRKCLIVLMFDFEEAS